jgi:hypothetical protein
MEQIKVALAEKHDILRASVVDLLKAVILKLYLIHLAQQI